MSMNSPGIGSDDETATLDSVERAILEERLDDLDDEENLLTVDELRSRFE